MLLTASSLDVIATELASEARSFIATNRSGKSLLASIELKREYRTGRNFDNGELKHLRMSLTRRLRANAEVARVEVHQTVNDFGLRCVHATIIFRWSEF